MAMTEINAFGFRIQASDIGQLEVKCWVFWTAEVAVAFEREALAACRAHSSLSSCAWNASEMKPQAEHGQIAIRKLMIMLSTLDATDCRIIADNALTKMQLVRLARESGLSTSKVGER